MAIKQQADICLLVPDKNYLSSLRTWSVMSRAEMDGLTARRTALQSEYRIHTMNLFSRFFQENQEKFLAFAYSYLRDKAEAEDVVMESMIALWENRDRWEENSNLHALLLTIIKNKAIRCVTK